MWTVLKFNKKNIENLKNQLIQKVGKDCVFYLPKTRLSYFKNNQLNNKEISLTGDYIFCYHPSFIKTNFLNSLKNLKGLKYFLNGYHASQNEIKSFISACKKNEDNLGFINISFVRLILNKKYIFKTGIFVNKIFQLINFNNNFLEISLGGLKTIIEKNKYSFEAL